MACGGDIQDEVQSPGVAIHPPFLSPASGSDIEDDVQEVFSRGTTANGCIGRPALRRHELLRRTRSGTTANGCIGRPVLDGLSKSQDRVKWHDGERMHRTSGSDIEDDVQEEMVSIPYLRG